MKFKLKKYIYLANDVTNLLLNKERVQAEENAKKLRIALIVISIVLVVSVICNIIFYFRAI